MILRLLSGLGARAKATFRRRRFESELDDELQFHLAEAMRRNIDRGMRPREADRAARQAFGGFGSVERTKDEVRGETGVRLLQDLTQDVKHAIRGVRRRPGFALVAVLTLALGIGANTAVFSAVNGVLLSPLPYDQPDRLVRLFSAWEERPEARTVLSALDFVDLREQVTAFEQLAGVYDFEQRGLDLAGPTGPTRLRALPVGAGYFETYRATPLLGRTFTWSEETVDAFVVILSHHAWRDFAGSDPRIIGQSLTFDGRPYTVIGVMRPSFIDVVVGDIDVWIPQNLQPGGFNSRENMYLSVIGRMAPGVSVAQAQAEVDVVTARLHEEFPAEAWRSTRVVSMFDDVVRESSTMLYVLMGAAAIVLLLACVNVANLALARGMARRGELGIRLALGSGRRRLVRQLLTESMLVAGIGGAAGVIVASLGLHALLVMSPESLPRAEEVGFDAGVLVFTLCVTVLTGLLFGLAPALGLTRGALQGSLREHSRGSTSTRRSGRVRTALVGGQVALAVMLLVGAGILMRSFVNLQRVQTGVETEGVMTFEVHLPEIRYVEGADRVGFHRQFQDRLGSLAGVTYAGATSWLPVNGPHFLWGLRWDGENGDDGLLVQVRAVEGDYFEALSIPVNRGRAFDQTDGPEAAPVAILSAEAARQAFEGGSALNRLVRTGGREWTVVGVVGDVATSAEGDIAPKIYFPHAQFGDRSLALSYVVSTSSASSDFLSTARRELATIDPQLVLYRPRPMADVTAEQTARRRFALSLMGTFAVIALLLAAVGLYGVLSYVVSQRVQEFGIRMALGARPFQIVRIVAGPGALVTGAGIAVGLAVAAALTRLLQALTFNISVTDTATFLAVATIIATTSVVAVALPSWRATRVDPIEALRGD